MRLELHVPPKKKTKKKEVADYRHEEATRPNNPSAALARDDTAETPKVKYEFDPHRDPELVWAGKAEQTEIEVDAPSLHIHERISAEAILRHAQREEAELTLFADPEMDRSKAIEFYEHEMGWANRLILGDSLHVMASLLERERMAGQVQMVFIDPPYGINYASNFQARVDQTQVGNKDRDLTREPEQIQAYRDTWSLGVHSYLTYMRERLLLSRELLASDGSIFVQIGDERSHLVRVLLDEVFGPECFVSQIAFRTKIPLRTTHVPNIYDHILWYSRTADAGRPAMKFHRLFVPRDVGEGTPFTSVELPDGSRRAMTKEERSNPGRLPKGARPFRLTDLASAGRTESCVFPIELNGKTYPPPASGKSWKTNPNGMARLIEENRVAVAGTTPRYVFYQDDYPVQELANVWTDTQGATGKTYAVQTSDKVLERCILMSTDPGDLVLDPTSGSGTTARAAEKHGRRWIGIDTSRVAIFLSRQRMLSGAFPYFRLFDSEMGPAGGFIYRKASHTTLGSIARGEDADGEILFDEPKSDSGKLRVSGPFTVESLSRYGENPTAEDLKVPESLITGDEEAKGEDAGDHRDLLLDALRHHGIPVQGGIPLELESVEPVAGSGEIHAEATAKKGKDEISIAVSIGPRYGPVTQIQVDDALDEAKGYDLVCFIGFAATAEVQKYLAPGKRGKVGVALVEANADLLLGDLLKNTSGSQTFRLFSSPDAEVKTAEDGEFVVELHGMDTYAAATGEVTSRNRNEIAAWFLDHDYDGTVFHVNQAFFTRADAWDALKKALKAEIDSEALEALNGFESLPFKPGESGRAAIRVIDDAGQTSEMVLELGD